MEELTERRKSEEEHRIRDEELKAAITALGEQVSRRLAIMESKIDPMYEIFTSVNGFNKIAVWMMKLLAGIGIALGGIYALIEFFKKLGK